MSAARVITATEREWPHSGQELSRVQEWCSAAQLAHRYERCSRTSLLTPTPEFCSPWNRSMAACCPPRRRETMDRRSEDRPVPVRPSVQATQALASARGHQDETNCSSAPPAEHPRICTALGEAGPRHPLPLGEAGLLVRVVLVLGSARLLARARIPLADLPVRASARGRISRALCPDLRRAAPPRGALAAVRGDPRPDRAVRNGDRNRADRASQLGNRAVRRRSRQKWLTPPHQWGDNRPRREDVLPS